ncbi:MAG TPA: AtpZ/AtpI family protein [Chitinophagaceae bacterium]|nr:AtpZ/AtpI family protein [Chitinophagaceae bacterium]
MKSRQQQQRRPANNSDLLRYAGLGTQIFVSLGIAVFAGYKADQWLDIAIPLFVWLLPFVVLAAMIYKLVKETSKKKKNEQKV